MFRVKHLFNRRSAALLAVSAPLVLGGALGAIPAAAYAQTVNAQSVSADAHTVNGQRLSADGHTVNGQRLSADGHTVNAQRESANWAGYVVRSKSGQHFSSVSGSWVQPSVSAGSGQGYSAFWVGIGGAGKTSKKLEQVGTSADVVNGKTQYSAWYELVPAPETELHLAIHPGDHISARVEVDGSDVTVGLSDTTTGQSVTKTLTMKNPDTKTAEWIAEAPSTATGGNGLQILPLADFDKVTFTNASATAGGHTGSISDPAWTAQKTELAAGAQSLGAVGINVMGGLPGQMTGSLAGAAPSDVSAGGTSFSVSYTSGAAPQGSGYPTGLGYPGGGYPGSGNAGGGYPGGGYPGGGYPGGGYLYVFPGGGYALLI